MVQIKIYHNRKGLRGRGGAGGRGAGGERAEATPRSALFTIFNMQSRHPSSPPPPSTSRLFAERARARERVRV